MNRCRVMGVLNVTSDSFSDGGRHLATSDAIDRGRLLRDQGADLVDVGGESTRPGATRVDPDVETARVVPVIRELAADGISLSVDTMRAEVAAAALEAGAEIVNDVSGGLADPDLLRVAADAGCRLVLMHWVPVEDYSAGAGGRVDYPGGVVAAVRDHLERRVAAAVEAGVAEGKIIVDPGLGFAKTAADNWALLRALDELRPGGLPLLVGASRKRFLGELLADDAGAPRPTDQRDHATAAVSTLAAASGAWGVRVHEVPPSVDAVAVAEAWRGDDGRPAGTELGGHAESAEPRTGRGAT